MPIILGLNAELNYIENGIVNRYSREFPYRINTNITQVEFSWNTKVINRKVWYYDHITMHHLWHFTFQPAIRKNVDGIYQRIYIYILRYPVFPNLKFINWITDSILVGLYCNILHQYNTSNVCYFQPKNELLHDIICITLADKLWNNSFNWW